MMKRSKSLGMFRARAVAHKFGYAGRLLHIEVDVQPVRSTTGRDMDPIVKWRGGFTPAAIHRTVRALFAMGASFSNNDPLDVTGVGTKSFDVELVVVECDLEETHGTEGVHRTFVHAIRPSMETAP